MNKWATIIIVLWVMTIPPANAFEIEQSYSINNNLNNIDNPHYNNLNNIDNPHYNNLNNIDNPHYNNKFARSKKNAASINNTTNELKQDNIHKDTGEDESSSILHTINIIGLIILTIVVIYSIYMTYQYFSNKNYVTNFNEKNRILNGIILEMGKGYSPTKGEMEKNMINPEDSLYDEPYWNYPLVVNQWGVICEWCPSIYTTAIELRRERMLEARHVDQVELTLGSMQRQMYISWGVLGIVALISTILFLIDYYHTKKRK